MRDSREIRYRASVPQALLLLVCCAALAAFGWQLLASGDDGIGTWVMIGLSGLFTLGMLIALVFALLRRAPVLATNSEGVTYFPPGRTPGLTVPWDDVACMSIDTERGSWGVKSYYLAVHARHPDRYTSKNQRALIAWYSAGRDVVMVVPLDLLFFWASRTRRAQVALRIEATFAPEIIQHGVEVAERG